MAPVPMGHWRLPGKRPYISGARRVVRRTGARCPWPARGPSGAWRNAACAHPHKHARCISPQWRRLRACTNNAHARGLPCTAIMRFKTSDYSRIPSSLSTAARHTVSMIPWRRSVQLTEHEALLLHVIYTAMALGEVITSSSCNSLGVKSV